MHSIVKTPQGYGIYLFTSNGKGDCLYLTETEAEAFAVASYLNGGEYPPCWLSVGARQADEKREAA